MRRNLIWWLSLAVAVGMTWHFAHKSIEQRKGDVGALYFDDLWFPPGYTKISSKVFQEWEERNEWRLREIQEARRGYEETSALLEWLQQDNFFFRLTFGFEGGEQ